MIHLLSFENTTVCLEISEFFKCKADSLFKYVFLDERFFENTQETPQMQLR